MGVYLLFRFESVFFFMGLGLDAGSWKFLGSFFSLAVTGEGKRHEIGSICMTHVNLIQVSTW